MCSGLPARDKANARHRELKWLTISIMSERAASKGRMSARALRLGHRLRTAGLEITDICQAEATSTSPLIIRVGEAGFAALFPYGTIVLIGVSDDEEEVFLQKLGDRIERRLDTPVIHVSQIETGTSEKISGDVITVRDMSPPCLVVVADALAKNVALAFEEEEVRKVIEVLEPFASDLANSGRLPRNRRRMLRTVGHALLIHQRLFDRVEVEDVPLLPDNADVEHLHKRLADGYHFKKRAKGLSRKLDAIEVMTSALTELLDAQRGIRLETMIVLLIVFEITITIYDLFLRAG
jgi:uncharacterized Rmd1/YagE family protein